MAKASFCPYCGSLDIKRSTTGYIEEGVGIVIGEGLGILAKSVGINHINTDGVRDMIPTNYVCNRCHKNFNVVSTGMRVTVLNEDTPENIKRKKDKMSGKFSCKIVKVDMTTSWRKFNTKRVLMGYCGFSNTQINKIVSRLPKTVSFETKELMEEFKESLANYNGKAI